MINASSNYNKKNRGAALLLFIMFFMFASVAISFAMSRSILSSLSQYALLLDSKQSYFAAESALEDMAVRTVSAMSVDGSETLTLLNGASGTAVSSLDALNGWLVLDGEGDVDQVIRKSQILLLQGTGASFNFGVQTGNGGFEMTNGSKVYGNVFSNGTIEKTGGGTATIYGDVISAGPTGLIDRIHATGTARAHTVTNSDIDGDVYAYEVDIGAASAIGGDVHTYELVIGSGNDVYGDVLAQIIDDGEIHGNATYVTKLNGTVVHGTDNPVAGPISAPADEDPVDLPIPDSVVEDIKQDILDNGTIIASTDPLCDPGVTDEYFEEDDLTLGFVKIECDFRFKKKGAGSTLTLTGPIWVEGNITFETGPDVVADSGVGNTTVPIIADDPSNRATGSTISIETGTSFTGSGSPKSYILLLSQNEDAENGAPDDVDAIFTGQSSAGDMLLYAGHGRITLANSIALKEITAHKVKLGNSAEVTYESGLVNTLFTSGPGGGYQFAGWSEI